MCLQSFLSPIMSSALRPIYSQADISECIFNNHPLVMREAMYVSIMCFWTWACLFVSVLIHSLLPSLGLVIVFSPDYTFSVLLCIWKYVPKLLLRALQVEILIGWGREAGRRGEEKKVLGRKKEWVEWVGGGVLLSFFFFRLQGCCFSKSAWGYTPAPRLP